MEKTDLEFEHFLAQKLAMTVGRMREEMSAEEYLRWSMFYQREAQRDELAMMRGR